MKDELKNLYDGLNDDVKAKLQNAKNPDELMQILKDEDVELNPEQLGAVAGGAPLATTDTCKWHDCDNEVA